MRTFVGGITLCLVLTGAALAEEPPAAAKKSFEKMLAAVQMNDRDAFVADGTEAVKKGTTPEIMDSIHKLVGARLKVGYQAAYLCQLRQAGYQIHLWKLTFKDKGDDVVVRMALKDGQVAGFFLQ